MSAPICGRCSISQRASDTLASRGSVETTSVGQPGIHLRLARRGRAAARLARHRARRRQLAQHPLDGGQHAAAGPRLPRGPARSRAQHASSRSQRGARPATGCRRARPRGCERAAGARSPLHARAQLRHGRVGRAGQEPRVLVQQRRLAGGVAAARSDAEAPARVGAAQQSPHGRQSRRRRGALQDPLVSAPRSARQRARSGRDVSCDRSATISSRATSASSSSSAAKPWRFSGSELRCADGIVQSRHLRTARPARARPRRRRHCSTSTSTRLRPSTKPSA